LIEEITVDCYGEDEELTGFLTHLEDALERPVEATVVGVPVTIVGADYPAGPLRGLVARCRRDGAEYEVPLLDLVAAGPVGGGEDPTGEVAAPGGQGGLGQRDDRHPLIRPRRSRWRPAGPGERWRPAGRPPAPWRP
jgi:hypothetical protein